MKMINIFFVFQNTTFPKQKVLTVGQFRISLTHVDQVVPWSDLKALVMIRCKLRLRPTNCYEHANKSLKLV